MAQTKAQRSAAAKKAAATRKRNAAKRSEKSAKGAARGAAKDISKAAKSVEGAAKKAVKAVSKRVEAETSARGGRASPSAGPAPRRSAESGPGSSPAQRGPRARRLRTRPQPYARDSRTWLPLAYEPRSIRNARMTKNHSNPVTWCPDPQSQKAA